MTGVDQQQLKPGVLEDIPHRPPIRPGRLHRDMRDPLGDQPVTQRLQRVMERLEGADLLLPTATLMRAAHTGDHHRLADVQRRAALMDDSHDDPLSSTDSTPPTKPAGSTSLILVFVATIPGACAGFTSGSLSGSNRAPPQQRRHRATPSFSSIPGREATQWEAHYEQSGRAITSDGEKGP